MRCQDVEHTFAIPNASARKNLVAEHSFLAVIVQTGTVQKQSFLVWFLNGPAGETARNFLHVLLGVSAIHAHRVQLHQFARVIFVEAAVDSGGLVSFGGIRTGNARTPIIKIVKHRRRMRGCAQQIAEPAHNEGTNGFAIETGEQVTIVILVCEDAEMVLPKINHQLVKLSFAIHSSQDLRPLQVRDHHIGILRWRCRFRSWERRRPACIFFLRIRHLVLHRRHTGVCRWLRRLTQSVLRDRLLRNGTSLRSFRWSR